MIANRISTATQRGRRRPGIPSILAALMLTSTLAAQDSTFSGRIDGEVRWQGSVLVSGDVEITSTGRLTIDPGTDVILSVQDAKNLGAHPQRIEFIVRGSLAIVGDRRQPVRFRAASPLDAGATEPTRSGWHGLVLHGTNDPKITREIRETVFEHAFAAVQIPAGGLIVESCVFRHCETGVEVGSSFVDRDHQLSPPGTARPTISGCRFTHCTTGVFAQLDGTPNLTRCVFFQCWTAAGNNRRGRTWPLHAPGTVSQQCDFIQNESGVFGPAVVMNSIFQGNQVALTPSRFHAVYDSEVDSLSYTSNLFFRNGLVIEGESTVGTALVDVDPQYTGTLDALDSDWPPRPDALRLAETSPARNAASHGGDLGCLGADRRAAGKVPWETKRPRVAQVMVLAQPPDLDGRAALAFPTSARRSDAEPGR